MDLVGRGAELAALSAWLEGCEAEPRALTIFGPAGVGKTSVWRAGLAEARRRGYLLASVEVAAAETQLAFAALGDVLEPLLPWLGVLPRPRRRVLSAALLLDEEAGAATELGPIGMATTSLMRAAAKDQPVLLAIDDRQWLDPSSRAVLNFVRRRLPYGVGVLTTLRTAGEGRSISADAPQELSFGHDADEGPLDDVFLTLSALTLSDLHQVLRSTLGDAPARPVLREIERLSAGNLVLAIELARQAIDNDGQIGGTAELASLVGRRVAALPRSSRRWLLRLAAGDETTPSEAALRPAVRAGLITVEKGSPRFAHPLYRSAILDSTPAPDLRAIHRALADATTDDEGRARHLALASVGPDETIARALDLAVQATRRRGAIADARHLAVLAVERSPEGPGRHGRMVEASTLAFQAGDTVRAVRLLDEALATSAGEQRVKVLLARAAIEHEAGGAHAVVTAQEALAGAHEAGDPALAAEACAILSAVDHSDFEQRRRHAEEAMALLATVVDPPDHLSAAVTLTLASARFETGMGLDRQLYQRAIELERTDPPRRVADRARALLAADLKYADFLDESRALLHAVRDEAANEGDDSSLTYAVGHLPQLEVWAGRWHDAEASAREHLELAEQMRQSGQQMQARYNLALVLAHLGRVDQALTAAITVETMAASMDDPFARANALTVRGFLELSCGRGGEAVVSLAEAADIRRRLHVREPGRLKSLGDLADALVLSGRGDEATGVIDELDRAGRGATHRSSVATAARSRAGLLLAGGAASAAVTEAEATAAVFADLGMPFERARSLLVLGSAQRRARRRREALTTLRAATDEFARLGAVLWEEQGIAEIERLGTSAGTRPAAGWDALTPAELGVIELVAQGLSNQEVAARLYVGVPTVKTHLIHVYRKVGIRSRAELMMTANRRGESNQPRG